MEVQSPGWKLLHCTYSIEAGTLDAEPTAHILLTLQARVTVVGDMPAMRKLHLRLPAAELDAWLAQLHGAAASLAETAAATGAE